MRPSGLLDGVGDVGRWWLVGSQRTEGSVLREAAAGFLCWGGSEAELILALHKTLLLVVC